MFCARVVEVHVAVDNEDGDTSTPRCSCGLDPDAVQRRRWGLAVAEVGSLGIEDSVTFSPL
jgi:hypothetical protein